MDMTMESCRKFVDVLASDAPAPGGGGASALVGAIGTALGNMVGSLTVGKKKYADVEAEILALMAKCDTLQNRAPGPGGGGRAGLLCLWPRPTASPRTPPTGIRSWRRPPSLPAQVPMPHHGAVLRGHGGHRRLRRQGQPPGRQRRGLRRRLREGGAPGGLPQCVHQHQDPEGPGGRRRR